ncbi:MAG: acyl-CoA/acyl-ACP dehydrogenase [Burkholderiales bacterium]|nr:acyl-CoA/acyl-ACP dehydrogenase [Burkholderiales bacterium]
MDFSLSEEQRSAIDGWHRHLERKVRPITSAHLDNPFPKDVAHELLRLTIPYGVGSGWIPEADGGAGLDFLTSGLLFEELSRTSPDLGGVAWVSEGAALKIQSAGLPALRDRYLPGLVSGDLIGCSATSEPGAGSNVREIKTRARRDGRNFRITGEKLWTSNATIADFALVVALTDERQYTMFLIDRQEHGYEAREISKLGLNGWSMGQLIFDEVLVPEENIIGGLGGGLRETMKGFERSRCFVSTLALGIAQSALDASIAYSLQRQQFGKAIAGHQLIQGLLAEMVTELEAARLLVYRALWLLSSGTRCELEAAIAKSFATEAAQRISSKAIQIHGASGLTREFPVERYFRNARLLTIPDGTTQINQLIIGRKLTGIDAFG